MMRLRDVRKSDLPELSRLARVLDTVNLPANERALVELVDHSARSFSGRLKDPLHRLYVFVLEDVRHQRLVGTSQIIAMHGTHEAPHVFLDLFEREHYSVSLDRLFRHQVMRIGYNYEGHTEIGGLVVDPSLRGVDKPGKQLSFVRFLFMAMHRRWFRERVLAELLPPLLPDGRSVLWEAFGARFTGLTYQEADKLSRTSKEFIKELFPQGEVYLDLLGPAVKDVVGHVGPATEGVRRMLEAIGFRYDQRIDPFDGGPHFSAATGDIAPVKSYRRSRLAAERLTGDAETFLVAVEGNRARPFQAVKTPCRFTRDEVRLPGWALELLGAAEGDRVHAIPFA
ncbi:MAG: hypothetical protein RL199_676 [Pseudomonadota bacterium]|jgi:arginine N-succinyltransferase